MNCDEIISWIEELHEGRSKNEVHNFISQRIKASQDTYGEYGELLQKTLEKHLPNWFIGNSTDWSYERGYSFSLYFSSRQKLEITDVADRSLKLNCLQRLQKPIYRVYISISAILPIFSFFIEIHELDEKGNYISRIYESEFPQTILDLLKPMEEILLQEGFTLLLSNCRDRELPFLTKFSGEEKNTVFSFLFFENQFLGVIIATLKPTHPGEILREEFLKPMHISAYRLAKDIGVPLNRITAILNEQRAISPETALLLSRYFGVSDSLWANLQSHYDLECAKDSLKTRLNHIPLCDFVANPA